MTQPLSRRQARSPWRSAFLYISIIACAAWPLLGFGAPPAWHDADGELRLLVFPGSAARSRLLVDLPTAWQGDWVDASAFAADGTSLPRRLIRLQGKIVAVEIQVPARTRAVARSPLETVMAESFQSEHMLHVYLRQQPLPADRANNLAPEDALAFYHRMESIKARPSTTDEFRTYTARNPTMRLADEWDKLPDSPTALKALAEGDQGDAGDREERRRRRDRYRALRYAFTGCMLIQDESRWEFAVPRVDTGPWFFEIDDEAVFSWGNPSDQTDSWLISEPVDLAQGLHSFTFGGALDEDQSTPVLHWRPAGSDAGFKPVDPSIFATDSTPVAWSVDRRDAVIAPGVALLPERVWHVMETGRDLVEMRYLDLTRNIYDREIVGRQLLVGDQAPLDLDARGLVYLPRLARRMRFTVTDAHGFDATLELPWRIPWIAQQRLSTRFELHSPSLLTPRDGTLTIGYETRMVVPGAIEDKPVPGALARRLELLVRRYGPDDRFIDQHRVAVPSAPHLRQLQIPFADRDVTRITIHPVLDATAVGSSRSIRLISPAELLALAVPVAASADALRADGEYLILTRRYAVPVQRQTPRPTIESVALMDSFIANGRHPTDDLDPAVFFRAQQDLRVQHVDLQNRRLQTFSSPLAKLAALRHLPTTDTVVWAVGPEDIAAGADLVDYRDTLAFIVEATIAQNRLPVLVTPPVLDDADAADIRPYALAVKELGAKYQVPVVDIYSMAMLADGLDRHYILDPESPTPVRSRTPDAAGRRWYFEQILKTIRHHNHVHRNQN